MTLYNSLGFLYHEIKIISEKLDEKIHFANSYSSWEIGINDNIIGVLIRQCYLKTQALMNSLSGR